MIVELVAWLLTNRNSRFCSIVGYSEEHSRYKLLLRVDRAYKPHTHLVHTSSHRLLFFFKYDIEILKRAIEERIVAKILSWTTVWQSRDTQKSFISQRNYTFETLLDYTLFNNSTTSQRGLVRGCANLSAIWALEFVKIQKYWRNILLQIFETFLWELIVAVNYDQM